MNRHEQNCFVGTRIRVDGDAWLGNLIDGCQVEIDHPPTEWHSNVIKNSRIHFVGEMERAMRLIAQLVAADPGLKAPLRKALGLGESGSPVAH